MKATDVLALFLTSAPTIALALDPSSLMPDVDAVDLHRLIGESFIRQTPDLVSKNTDALRGTSVRRNQQADVFDSCALVDDESVSDALYDLRENYAGEVICHYESNEEFDIIINCTTDMTKGASGKTFEPLNDVCTHVGGRLYTFDMDVSCNDGSAYRNLKNPMDCFYDCGDGNLVEDYTLSHMKANAWVGKENSTDCQFNHFSVDLYGNSSVPATLSPTQSPSNSTGNEDQGGNFTEPTQSPNNSTDNDDHGGNATDPTTLSPTQSPNNSTDNGNDDHGGNSTDPTTPSPTQSPNNSTDNGNEDHDSHDGDHDGGHDDSDEDPSKDRNCDDSPLLFMVHDIPRCCKWISEDPEERCHPLWGKGAGLDIDIPSHCPNACKTCLTYGCKDTSGEFIVDENEHRECCWLDSLSEGEKRTKCSESRIYTTCPDTCGRVCIW